MISYDTIRRALDGRRLPAAFVDLDAFDHNVGVMASVARGVPIRLATKSVRVRSLILRALERGGEAYRGLMCFSVEEAAFLSDFGFDDLLVAYPPYQASDLELAARLSREGTNISVAADCAESIDRIGTFARAQQTEVRIIVCIDMSLRLARGRVHLGVWRSPIHSPDQALGLARHVLRTAGTKLHGLLGYEAQVAGLGDASPFDPPALRRIKAWVRMASVRQVRQRRESIMNAFRDAGIPIRLFNGGGTGSLSTTVAEPAVSEVTAGSGLFKPHLFDYYGEAYMHRLQPAAYFALEVTRTPVPNMVTCLGGGYVASGATGKDKAPLPWMPKGLALVGAEMAGEVQTPLQGRAPANLRLGDPVVFRHAKGGELAERFDRVLLLKDGRVVDTVPTYRGEGQCFF